MGKAFQKIKEKDLAVYGGRPPTEPNDDIIKRVCNLMRAGAYIETACVASGVSKDTLKRWIKLALERDEKGRANGKINDTVYGKFLAAVEQAGEECVARDLANIDKCAMGAEFEYERWQRDVLDPETGAIIHQKGDLVFNARGNPIVTKMGHAPDWHASAWRLERRHSSKWARSETVNQKVSGKVSGAPQIVVTLPSNSREAKKENAE